MMTKPKTNKLNGLSLGTVTVLLEFINEKAGESENYDEYFTEAVENLLKLYIKLQPSEQVADHTRLAMRLGHLNKVQELLSIDDFSMYAAETLKT